MDCGAWMIEAEKLRANAARCRRLAKTINAEDAVALLEEMAQELERQAQKLEAGEKQERNTAD
jgi:hypothetical protein